MSSVISLAANAFSMPNASTASGVTTVPACQLRRGDVLLCCAGQLHAAKKSRSSVIMLDILDMRCGVGCYCVCKFSESLTICNVLCNLSLYVIV